VSTGGELKSMASLGIASISLETQKTAIADHGNTVGLVSSYQTTDGMRHAAGDVWFQTLDTPAAAAPAPKPTDLGARVTNLVQAMGEFGAAAGASSLQGSLTQATSDTIPAAAALATASVGSMVDLLKQFDSSGHGVLNPSTTSAAPSTKLNVPALGNAVTNGILALGGNK